MNGPVPQARGVRVDLAPSPKGLPVLPQSSLEAAAVGYTQSRDGRSTPHDCRGQEARQAR